MRFSLQDVKKQIHRRNGELSVSLHFLQTGEAHSEIEKLIAYYEQQRGQAQRQFSSEQARACVGEYRLANCLTATLSAWYTRQQPDWHETTQRLGEETVTLLAEAMITSPLHLRLALFSYVNLHHAGFLDASTRLPALQAFAQTYQLSVPNLEYLLALDSEEEALLVRTTPSPPTVQDVTALYNQWAFEAALCNASSVHFVIDCRAFATLPDEGGQSNVARSGTESGVGAVIKRLCYLARKIGVYYDLAYEASSNSQQQASEHPQNIPLHLTLYGPQEVTGVAQQYGLRLARLCRLLLGYGNTGQKAKGAKARISARAILEAEATVHFLQRSYRFALDARLLSLLPMGEADASHEQRSPDTSSVFDSSIEQAFAEAFSTLEQSQGVDGWRLEREPEPLLLETGIFIPDFALTRGIESETSGTSPFYRRIYMEILGFWTPAYRERKIQKLQQLKGRDDLVLAIPVEAQAAFAPIASDFPIVWYTGQLSASELLHLLRNRYDDFAQRLAMIDVERVRECVQSEGLVPERACYGLLHCYRRSELARAAERVINANTSVDIAFGPGIGLYSGAWLEQIRGLFVEWIRSAGTLPLAEVLRISRERWHSLAACEDATIETLLGLWPEVQVRRTSIFEATVELGVREGEEMRYAVPEEASRGKQLRERRTTAKKRPVHESETTQSELWT